MSTIKQQLEDQWKEEKEKLDNIKIDDKSQIEFYKIQVERVKSLEKELADLEKSENETAEKVASRRTDEVLRKQQMEDESKDRKTRNIIEVAKVVVPVVGAFAMGLISMKWEKTDTLTSSAGKSSLREILRFK